jgi:hypothetical protein
MQRFFDAYEELSSSTRFEQWRETLKRANYTQSALTQMTVDTSYSPNDIPTLEQLLAAVEKRIDLCNSMEMADFRASREDYDYDPYGDGAMKLFETKMRLEGKARRLRLDIKRLKGIE